MLKEWLPSDLYKLSRYQTKEWLPFQNSHKKALKALYKNSLSLRDDYLVVGWYKGNQLLAVCDGEIKDNIFCVTNIVSTSYLFGFSECMMLLDEIAKSRLLSEVYLPDFSDVSLVKNKLLDLDFVRKNHPKPGYYYHVNYHTGIVLGGGGARGSYQIGAWRALKELGVTYSMISGTSVGALNGAFMVQGNLHDAEDMWRDIATNKILNLSLGDKENKTRENLIQGVKNLTLSALKENGADSTPLYHMIEMMIDEDRMFDPNKKPIDFYFVTTHAPKMEETVKSLKDVPKDELSKWLLATSSFYPAMRACEINGQYYVDGGYRNNIPKDILLNHGAKELIVIDVKGPGVIKPVKTPRDICEITISSKWGLGTVLLFDKERAIWNMQLGYLDTMRTFHRYEGNWYALEPNNYKKEAVKLTKHFLMYLKSQEAIKQLGKKVTPRWMVQHHVQPELFSIYLLEETARILSVDPSRVYAIDELSDEIVTVFNEKNDDVNDQMLLSLSEWLADYVKQTVPLSEKTVLTYNYHLIETKVEIIGRLFDISWKPVLQALFIHFLKERKI